jgi:branched-chain amino acid aminotransferase
MLLTTSLRRLGGSRAFSFVRHASTAGNPIDASKMVVTKTETPKPLPELDGLGFGKVFSDHMMICDWDVNTGWHAPTIVPYGPMELSPAASSLHYALQCFEGMKAYKNADGEALLFRPDMNMKRFEKSMARLHMPGFDHDQLLDCIKQLVRMEDRWIPERDGYSLYLRPTAISTHPFVGVAAPEQVRIFTILSPVGPYYPEGFKPVTLFADPENRRAWPGGTGDVKIGGNYAPTISPASAAVKKGYSQILWLFGPRHLVTEVGTMNLMFLWKNGDRTELVTAPLDGTILPGVTRDSILSLCREWGEFDVVERDIEMAEVTQRIADGEMIEAFGCGTAAVVSPIKLIHYDGKDMPVPLDREDPTAQAGKLTTRVQKTMIDIQYGRIEHPWSVKV